MNAKEKNENVPKNFCASPLKSAIKHQKHGFWPLFIGTQSGHKYINTLTINKIGREDRDIFCPEIGTFFVPIVPMDVVDNQQLNFEMSRLCPDILDHMLLIINNIEEIGLKKIGTFSFFICGKKYYIMFLSGLFHKMINNAKN